MDTSNSSSEYHGQTNIHGDLSTDGGLVNTGTINTGGAPVIGRDQIIIHQRLDPADLRNQRNHTVLRQAVRRFWVDGVLKGSLYNEVRIRLGLDARPEAVDNRPWNLTLHQTGKPDRTIAHDKEIVDIFGEMSQQLLILGEPGSGKTTTLLTLADELLIHTEQDPTSPTPVVFNLSSWAEKQPKLEEWLVDELKSRYQMPSKVAAGWVKNDELLLLMDGLDEVAEAKRNGCVNAINAFRQEHLVGLAICSRTVEYAALRAQLKLAGAVAVRSLTQEQIDDYLEKTGAQASALKQVLAESDELRELAQTPLMLSVMTLAYQEQNTAEPAQQAAGRTIRQQLFDRYIRRMFQHREPDQHYTAQQTVHWLHWLAAQMAARSQTTLLVEQLQPDWLGSQRTVDLYRLSLGLIGGLSFGLFVGMMFGLSFGLFVGMMFGLSFGLSFGLFVGLSSGKVTAYELLNFSWKSGLIFGLIGGLGGGLSVGMISGLISGTTDVKSIQKLRDSWKERLIFGLSGGLISGATDVKSIQKLRDSWKERLIFGLIGGLIFGLGGGPSSGLGGGLIFGLIGWLIGGKRASEAKVKVRVNQGIWQSLRNALISGLIFGLSVGVIGWLISGLRGWLIGWLISWLIGGLRSGLDTCIKHVVLRYFLYYEGRMPWNYARFLDYAAARLYLRKVGGGYVFIHRLIMEHFASLTDADIARITADLE